MQIYIIILGESNMKLFSTKPREEEEGEWDEEE